MATRKATDNRKQNSGIKNLKPFVKGDPRINRKGAPKRGQSWAEVIKKLTDMTREELIKYVGPKTRLGRLLMEMPEGIPIKESLVIATIIAYGREPNARMLSTIMDREDGKSVQPVEVNGKTIIVDLPDEDSDGA
jgi:hypothetical protein